MTINILAFDWFRGDGRYHRAFHVQDDETGEPLCDDLEIHFLELDKIKTIKRRPEDALEAWMMYLSNLEGEEMGAIAMENPGIRKALTIEKAFWQSKKERRLYELREKAMRDEISALAGAGNVCYEGWSNIIPAANNRSVTCFHGLLNNLHFLLW